jgi:hypothetical protein
MLFMGLALRISSSLQSVLMGLVEGPKATPVRRQSLVPVVLNTITGLSSLHSLPKYLRQSTDSPQRLNF